MVRHWEAPTPDHLSETVSKAAFVLKEIASGGDPLATAKRRELREFLDRRLAGKNPTALDAAARRKGRSLHGDFERLESALARPDQNSPEALHELESALSEVLASLREAGLIERDDCDAICAPGWVDAPDMSFQFKPVDMERLTAGLEMALTMIMTFPGDGTVEAAQIDLFLSTIRALRVDTPSSIGQLRDLDRVVTWFLDDVESWKKCSYWVTHGTIRMKIEMVLNHLVGPTGLDRRTVDKLWMLTVPPATHIERTFEASFDELLTGFLKARLNRAAHRKFSSRYEAVCLRLKALDIDMLAAKDKVRGDRLRVLLGQLRFWTNRGASEATVVALMSEILELMEHLTHN